VTSEVAFVVRLTGFHAGGPYQASLDIPGPEYRLATPKAIYLAYDRARRLHYVGKVDRGQRGTVAQRIREHTRRSRRKRDAWRVLWIVPIAETVSRATLFELERAIISALQPIGNRQHVRAA
jgi:hypothetical protein